MKAAIFFALLATSTVTALPTAVGSKFFFELIQSVMFTLLLNHLFNKRWCIEFWANYLRRILLS